MPKQNLINTVLGFDFGMSFIGIAVGQRISCTAKPLTALKANDGIPDWNEIKNLIEDWEIDAFVVGMPNADNKETQRITLAAKKFANRLTGRYGLPVFFVDETLTTYEAKRDRQRFKLSERADSFAAKLILESWLQQHNNKLN